MTIKHSFGRFVSVCVCVVRAIGIRTLSVLWTVSSQRHGIQHWMLDTFFQMLHSPFVLPLFWQNALYASVKSMPYQYMWKWIFCAQWIVWLCAYVCAWMCSFKIHHFKEFCCKRKTHYNSQFNPRIWIFQWTECVLSVLRTLSLSPLSSLNK